MSWSTKMTIKRRINSDSMRRRDGSARWLHTSLARKKNLCLLFSGNNYQWQTLSSRGESDPTRANVQTLSSACTLSKRERLSRATNSLCIGPRLNTRVEAKQARHSTTQIQTNLISLVLSAVWSAGERQQNRFGQFGFIMDARSLVRPADRMRDVALTTQPTYNDGEFPLARRLDQLKFMRQRNFWWSSSH